MRGHHNRRTFIGAGGAGLSLVAGRTGRAAPGERVRVAVIGLRNRGTDHARMFAASPHAEVVAVCDVDDAMFAKPVKAVEAATGKAPRTEKDFRRLLDDKTIDAVTIATPDHWHALFTVRACQANKDVYVEKPASHDVVEGRRMVEAARKYDRGKPNADIEIGHLSTRLCLLGNIAHRTGKKLTFDAATECFHDAAADALLSREYSSRFEMPSHV